MKIRTYLDRVSSSLKPKNNMFLIVFVVIVFAVLVDSQIGIVSDFIPEYLSSSIGVSLFVGLTGFSIFSSFFMINYVRRINSLTAEKYAHFRLIYYLALISQCLIAAILVLVVTQILLFQEYNIICLFIINIISYGIWIGLLALLTRAFILWYKNFNKNIMILIFAIAMNLICYQWSIWAHYSN